MPTVKLLSYTGDGNPDKLYAARLIAYTKNTRMSLTPAGLESYANKSEEEILSELEYVAATVPSSHEMADLMFSVTDISRNTALQLLRTRTGSYAHQAQRVVDVREAGWDTSKGDEFNKRMAENIANYAATVDAGMPVEDARDLLPSGLYGNLIAKYNFRNLIELVRKRQSIRVQGNYHSIITQMKAEVLRVWPWSATFFEHPQDKALRMIEEVALALRQDTGAIYKGHTAILAKAVDLIRTST